MSIVAFGDWHGNEARALRALEDARSRYTNMTRAIHVGDFGFWSTNIFTDEFMAVDGFTSPTPDDTQGYVHEVDRLCEELGITLYVCLGNHENYWELEDTFGYYGAYCKLPQPFVTQAVIAGQGPYSYLLPEEYMNDERLYCTGYAITEPETVLDEDGFITSQLFPNVRLIPRAHVWEWDGVRYASLGGAHSIDVSNRERGYTWWEQETVDPSETGQLIKICEGKGVDVLITHDGPVNVTKNLYGHGIPLPPDVASWARKSGEQVQIALNSLNPRLHVCGHHHVRETFLERNTVVEILDRETGTVESNRLNITERLSQL